MAFELISWVYISCICFAWGDLFVRFIYGLDFLFRILISQSCVLLVCP